MTSEKPRYLALLRGINVGGNNIIRKDELAQAFTDLDFSNVKTYIQSGNILFRADETDIAVLTERIETQLSERFSYTAHAVVLSYARYKAIVESAPETWGQGDDQRHNLAFVLHNLDSEALVAELASPKDDIETITPVDGAIYWSIDKAQATKATYAKFPRTKVYKQVTVRNHNTTYKLLALFDQI